MRASLWGLMMVGLVIFFVACEKDKVTPEIPNDNNLQTQNFVHNLQSAAESQGADGEPEDSTDYELECFDFVYPIEVNIPNQEVVSVNSEDEFFDVLDQWFEANEEEEDLEDFPTLVFPIQVTLEDGTMESIGDEEELCELYETCFEDEFGEDWNEDEDWDEDYEHEEDMCFTFEFPVTVNLPDGSSSAANTEEELEDIFDDWFENNEDEEAFPTFAYPVTVVLLEDSTTQIINSDEELDELFEECYDDFFEDCFEVNYPVEVELPDGTVLNAIDEEAFYDILDDWYDGLEEDEEPEDYPTFVYPIEVTLEDGTVESVEDEEDLEELYEECYGEICPVDGEVLNTGGDIQAATKTVLKRKVSVLGN